MAFKRLSLCVDLYGCPNRCRHCWLGHMPNRTMEAGADEWLVERFKPYFEQIEFYSWLREPDFCPDYRARWEAVFSGSVSASTALTPGWPRAQFRAARTASVA